MRIKLFEAFEDADKKDYEGVFIMGLSEKEGYYEESSQENWNAARLNYERLVDFPIKCINYINSRAVRKTYQGWKNARESGHNTAYCNDAYTNPTTGRRYTRSTWIFLLDDDWYEVQDCVSFGGSTLEIEWYRCDQWDGLVELLKDKKIII